VLLMALLGVAGIAAASLLRPRSARGGGRGSRDSLGALPPEAATGGSERTRTDAPRDGATDGA
jgi:hypothetical protein